MEDSEEQEIFEIIDFTTVSGWERFVARVEEIIHDWKCNETRPYHPLTKDEVIDGNWQEVSEEISFGDVRFLLTRHFLRHAANDNGDERREEDGDDDQQQQQRKSLVSFAHLDMMNKEMDFPARAHCLTRWFGIRDFVVLSPAPNAEAIIGESRMKILLSSFIIALHNTQCRLPAFVQVVQHWRRLYAGVCDSGAGMRTHFEMVHLKNTPRQLNHLAGLIEVFKTKLMVPISPAPPILVSVRFTYVLRDWAMHEWPIEDEKGSATPPPEGAWPCVGTVCDPIFELHLAATWPNLAEEMIVDNETYSDLDPTQAPSWSVRVKIDEEPQLLLGDLLKELLVVAAGKSDAMFVPPEGRDEGEGRDIQSALQRLTEPVPSISTLTSSVVSRARRKLTRESNNNVIPELLLNAMLEDLLPDVDPPPAPEPPDESGRLHDQLKSCSVSSLTHRAALLLCEAYQQHGGVRGMLHLWQEIILELRYRWDNNILLPWTEHGHPDLGASLLHQKLQLLNCCIERKRARENEALVQGPVEEEEASASEDEFFECEETVSDEDGSPLTRKGSVRRNDVFRDSKPQHPDGRLKRLGDIRLLDTGAPLYVPITQEPAPMTEDMLAEHEQSLVELGHGEEAAKLRAQMQSASLLSDMEAFKAANPGCKLDDFVRWHSPRDWNEGDTHSDDEDDDGGDEQTDQPKPRGRLSKRMRLPGNIWAECWQSTKSVAARKQRRLFDDTKETEKTLQWLSSLRPSQLVLNLLPCLVHAAMQAFQVSEKCHPSLSLLYEQTFQRTVRATRMQELRHYEELVQKLCQLEMMVSRFQSLKAKFSSEVARDDEKEELARFVDCIMEKPEVKVIGAAKGPVGRVVHRMFAAARTRGRFTPAGNGGESALGEEAPTPATPTSSDFPPPEGREFILRTECPRPAPYSQVSPHRMYCVLTREEFRLSAAFSEDTAFH